ncbi:hypothetical protein F3Y22_tig00009840pilonHSYRG00015 [Hibiscus syriacus]|uniref:Reverse transcriptase domain-containing protein n=1 Tax=Hibiscus syriacus TaxID=106335 RepID=A0A6A3C6R3_HIBSY|nr:hypothetical protein F3Y22_tig00009840pilonHSYRG00015 [Hibiscus syriacus]
MQRIINSLWGKSSPVKVSLAGSNLYVFSFMNASVREWVLENGPWHVQNKPLVLRKWEPYMQKLDFDLYVMPVWFHLYNVLLELYSRKGLSYISSALGNPLYMDSITASRERLEYAKVCVEINAGSEIPEEVNVALKNGSLATIKVFVSWLPKSCSCCRTFGHLANRCVVSQKVKHEVKVWREKGISSSELCDKGKMDSIVIQSFSPVLSDLPLGSSSNVSSALGAGVSNHELLVGNAVETNVSALQELPTISHLVVVDGSIGVDDSNKEDTCSVGDFPTLKDSMASNKKARGRKKGNTGSSSKFESLAEGGVLDGPRKARVASLGVAALLNQIKSKKRDLVDKAKISGNVGTGSGVGNSDFAEGGIIWILWRKQWSFSILSASDQSLSIAGNINGCRTLITAVYGSNSGIGRRGLWDHLRSLESLVGSSPWVVGGDFNVVLSVDESSDFESLGVHNSSDMEDFQDCLGDLDLLDHPFLGPTFTWSNRQDEGFLARKLDRILVNPEWLTAHPDSFAEFKAQGASDHCLGMIWTQNDALARRPKPFKFFNCWTSNVGFMGVVKLSWLEQCAGNPMQRLFSKLKRLKPRLKELNKEHFSDISSKVLNKRAELERIQLLNLSCTDQRSIEEERNIHAELVDLEIAESEFYRQIAKVHWLREGDLNTKFFHQRVESNKKRNTIKVLLSGSGQYLDSFDDIANELVNFFTNLIGTTDPMVENFPVEWLKDLLNYSLPEGAGDMLIKEVDDKEIKEALFRHGNGKSPGPNGFSSWFFKAAWDVVGNDFLAAVRYFFHSSSLLPAFNATSIILVPKSLNACMAKDFRPISCCSVVYKTITRIITTRLALIFPSMISPSQYAFVKGRNIVDNTLLAQEILKGYSRKSLSPRCAIKIDLQKAFYSFSVSLNGSLVGFFKGARGVRQGDPLSPYLFVLVMNVFSSILDVAAKRGVFKYHPKCKRISLTHLCFADDLLIFCHGSFDSVMGVLSTLETFYKLSGLRLNAMKTELYVCGVSDLVLGQIKAGTGFRVGNLPVRYLGVPLVTRKLTSKDCTALVTKIKEKLSKWANKRLSFGGRLQLIKYVIFSIFSYWSRHLILPKGVIRDVEKLSMRFFWKGSDSSARGARVSWKHICLLKSEGGLGLRSLTDWSKACCLLLIKKILAGEVAGLKLMLGGFRIIFAVEVRRLSTKDRLARFGIAVDSGCGLCRSGFESRDHIFSDCAYAVGVWHAILHACALNLGPLCWNDLVCWLLLNLKGKSLLVHILKLAWSGFIYFIWEERNHGLFRG